MNRKEVLNIINFLKEHSDFITDEYWKKESKKEESYKAKPNLLKSLKEHCSYEMVEDRKAKGVDIYEVMKRISMMVKHEGKDTKANGLFVTNLDKDSEHMFFSIERGAMGITTVDYGTLEFKNTELEEKWKLEKAKSPLTLDEKPAILPEKTKSILKQSV